MQRADQITKAGAVANVGMAALKGVVGTASCSPALQADAVHSLTDLVSDGVSLWALRKARLPRPPFWAGCMLLHVFVEFVPVVDPSHLCAV